MVIISLFDSDSFEIVKDCVSVNLLNIEEYTKGPKGRRLQAIDHMFTFLVLGLLDFIFMKIRHKFGDFY